MVIKAGSPGSVEVGYHTGASGSRFVSTGDGALAEGTTALSATDPVFTLTAPAERSVTVHSKILGIASDPTSIISVLIGIADEPFRASGGVQATPYSTDRSFPDGQADVWYSVNLNHIVAATPGVVNFVFSGCLPASVGSSMSLHLLDCLHLPPGHSMALWAWATIAPTFFFSITHFEERK